MKPTGNTILITGGGTGIGRALAHRLNDLGNMVIVAGRRSDTLDETVAGRDHMAAAVLDIEDAGAVARFAREILQANPAINVLINNAGIMRFEAIDGSRDLTDAEAMVTTNLLGPIRLTDAFVDHLSGKPGSAIVNVTSGLAFVPLVSTPTYNATKAALHSYTIALREQLRGKVEVIEITPPAVQTDLTPGQSTREGYLPLEEYIDETMELLQQQPTPSEILVERVKFLRNAESERRFEETLAALNA